MVFFLRKFVEALLLPIGVAGLLATVGIVFRRRWIVALGVVILYTFSTPVMGRWMMRSLERVYTPQAVDSCLNADAIVVLSGGIIRGRSAPGVQWGDNANRYFAGFDLAMAGKAKRIVLSAGPPNPRGSSQGEVLRQIAIGHGLEQERIVVTPFVFTTEDEASVVAKMPNIHSILLVTSAFHMPRAVLLFRSQGFDVSPFPTDQRVLGSQPFRLLDFIPGSTALQESEQAMREYYGLAVYRSLLAVK
jgi:uncharacterized SAM-binding protein YcdF (DUF218 family)